MQKPNTINEFTMLARVVRDIKCTVVGREKPMNLAKFDVVQGMLFGKKLKTPYYFHCMAWQKAAADLDGVKKGTDLMMKGFLQQTTVKKDGRTYNNFYLIVQQFEVVATTESRQLHKQVDNELEEAEAMGTTDEDIVW